MTFTDQFRDAFPSPGSSFGASDDAIDSDAVPAATKAGFDLI